jgi:T5SS/PEP-CTERM-associated repeat protein/autotransporter-associated beta strand protein
VGNWANSTNWNPGFEPTAADDAVIERDGSMVLVTTGGRTARSVTLGGSGGGSVTITPGSLTVNSFIIVGPSAGGFGTLIIEAGGSATAQNLIVGESGVGILAVQNGGILTDFGGFVGDLPGSQGTVTVSGAGSTWTNTDTIQVGGLGTGTLTIQSGGTVSDGVGAIGNLPGSSGTVRVAGPNATWTNSGNLYVGFFGTGTLTIQSGGTVSDVDGEIGFVSDSSGTVTVSGRNATWTNTGTVFVGDNGTGELTIQNGGLVQVGGFGLFISNSRFGTGTLNIGAAPGSDPVPPGTLETSKVRFGGSGTGVINFNHTATDYVFAPTISGPGKVNVFSGTTILTGNNTYSKGTTIEGGILVAGTSTALGTGNVSVSGGALTTPCYLYSVGILPPQYNKALIINVGGNYTQGPGGTLALGISGLDGSQYDHVQVAGTATVDGTLVVDSQNGVFRPSDGNAFEILSSKGSRSGEFARVDDFFNNNPNLQRVDIYAPNGVALLYTAAVTPVPTPTPIPPVPVPTPSPAPPVTTPNPTPNPRPPIDVVDPEPLPPVQPGEPLPPSFLLPVLDPTVEELTSLYQIGFSAENMQRFNLGDRMFQIQQSVVLPPPVSPYQPSYTKEGKEVEGKAPPAPPPNPINRWGVWASGWGDFANVDSTSAAQGYRFTLGGVSAGVDCLLIPNHLAFGLFGGYSHSWIHLTPSGSADANTGRGGLYVTYFNQGWWVDVAGWAGGTNYSTSRQGILGMANGSTSGWEASTFGEAGKDFLCGNFTFGPVVAMQYTNVHVNGFGENGSLVPLDIHGDSQDSLVTDVGGRAYYTWQGAKTTIIPKVELYWEHEYLYSNLPLTISAPDLDNATTTVSGPNVGHDSMIIGASLSIRPTSWIWLTIGYNGQALRDHYLSNSVVGTLSFGF